MEFKNVMSIKANMSGKCWSGKSHAALHGRSTLEDSVEALAEIFNSVWDRNNGTGREDNAF